MAVKSIAIVIVGDELLSGRIRDVNASYLAQRLRELGSDLQRIEFIGDQVSMIAETVRRLSPCHDSVLLCGGIGPTHDDVTMEGVAEAFGVGLVQRPELVALLHAWGKKLPEGAIERLASIPDGAELITVEDHFPAVMKENVFILPGVPKLLRAKFEWFAHLFRSDERSVETILFVLERSELVVAEAIARLAETVGPEVSLGSYPQRLGPISPELQLVLTARNPAALERAKTALLNAFPDARELSGGQGETESDGV